jgi:hypothetical protein
MYEGVKICFRLHIRQAYYYKERMNKDADMDLIGAELRFPSVNPLAPSPSLIAPQHERLERTENVENNLSAQSFNPQSIVSL